MLYLRIMAATPVLVFLYLSFLVISPIAFLEVLFFGTDHFTNRRKAIIREVRRLTFWRETGRVK